MGLKIIGDGLAFLWVEDSISTDNNVAVLIKLPPPEVNTAMLLSPPAHDTWKDSVVLQDFPSQPANEDQSTTSDAAVPGASELETADTGKPGDDSAFGPHLTLVGRTLEDTHEVPLTLKEGDILVLEKHNAVEVKEGGFPVMVVRYRVEP